MTADIANGIAENKNLHVFAAAPRVLQQGWLGGSRRGRRRVALSFQFITMALNWWVYNGSFGASAPLSGVDGRVLF